MDAVFKACLANSRARAGPVEFIEQMSRFIPAFKMVWTSLSKAEFDELRQRAVAADKLSEFNKVHKAIALRAV